MSTIRTWPARIYLQQEEVAPYKEHSEVTWCADRINKRDVEYVRIDLFNSLKARLKRRYVKMDTEDGPVTVETCPMCGYPDDVTTPPAACETCDSTGHIAGFPCPACNGGDGHGA
jgi:hypothetical protein